ncbi:MAG: hypothetical protein ACSLFO_02235 [Acidimicrobiales bacterium]
MFRLLCAVVVAATAVPPAFASAAPPTKPIAGGVGTVLVGAASRSVLPLVDGSLDYLSAGFPDRADPHDPGILVPEWDAGRIAVGNGDSSSAWVHDDLQVTALAVNDPRSRDVVVMVGSDLYMIFRTDGDEIRAKAEALLPPGLAARTRIVVTANHNHHGPDTAFDVNHEWYDHMTDMAAEAVADAVLHREPARLTVTAGEHWFGMNDGTDPQIFDPTLNVLQATAVDGEVLATAVQWNNHPEGTLSWGPPDAVIAEDCQVLGLEDGPTEDGDACDAEGRYFTADYPGILREDLQAAYGGEVLYLNGALGVLIGPGGAHVWEVNETHPLGNQLIAPAGAEAPGGGTDYTTRNFRRTAIIGEQLADAVIRLVDADTERITKPRVSYDVEHFYTRLSNIGFRYLLVEDPATGRSDLGHNVGTLYTCELPASDQTCTPDGGATQHDSVIGDDIRVGDHLRSAVEYIRIGSVGMMFLPGEIPGELTIGLPSQFRTAPDHWYEEPAGRHAFGDDYTIPGYTTARMDDPYPWTVGLGSDQLGYVIPISNFRVLCVADELLGAGTCAGLHEAGHIEFPDAVAGTTCKEVTEDPARLSEYPSLAGFVIGASCRYGQALGEAEGHYEETNSVGWDVAADMMAAVAAITGDPDPTQVNPDFPGWWQGFLPPGDLP